MTTTKTSKISLNTIDDKKFYVNIIKSYPHDENLYLFKRDLLNKICQTGWGGASFVTPTKAKGPSPIKNASLDGHKDLLINNFKKLTVNDDRKLILAAIRLYNALL